MFSGFLEPSTILWSFVSPFGEEGRTLSLIVSVFVELFPIGSMFVNISKEGGAFLSEPFSL